MDYHFTSCKGRGKSFQKILRRKRIKGNELQTQIISASWLSEGKLYTKESYIC